MIRCPHCIKHLERENTPDGIFWRCPSCEGRAITMPVLRKMLDAGYLNSLWKFSMQGERAGVCCAFCQNEMRQIPAGPISVDICHFCQTAWFDTSEFEQAPRAKISEIETPEPMPQKAREILAMAEIERIRNNADAKDGPINPPASPWQAILTIFGFPVEENEHPVSCLPWISWTLALLMVGVTAIALISRPEWIENFGLIPAQSSRHHGLTFLTSFFLHAGWLHLIGNLYFLLVFGDNVEDFLGKGRYLLLVALSSLVGDFGHSLLDPRATEVLIGASGGISGILGFYAVQFPHARICISFRYFLYIRWLRIPAVYLFVIWIGLQFLTVWQQTLGTTHISGAAHLGGAAVGVLFALAGKWGAVSGRKDSQEHPAG